MMDAETQKILIQVGVPAFALITMGCVGIFFNFLLEIWKLRHKKHEIRFSKFHDNFLDVYQGINERLHLVQNALLELSETMGEIIDSKDDLAARRVDEYFHRVIDQLETNVEAVVKYQASNSLYTEPQLERLVNDLYVEMLSHVVSLKNRTDGKLASELRPICKKWLSEKNDNGNKNDVNNLRSAIYRIFDYLKARISQDGQYW